jgi:1-aminocyclopropane-1-carboxylate deaminase
MRPPAIVPHSVQRATVWEVRDFERCLVPGVCGNKARKFAGLNDETARVPLVSHGGAQSNAMLALAALAAHRRVAFTYHTKPMPRWLRAKPIGNLAAALSLGMELREHATAGSYEAAARALAEEAHGARFVPQGGACAAAEPGVASLARDIRVWHAGRGGAEPCHVILPAGTGTTALFLARHVPPGVRVFAVPCVGDEAYLRFYLRFYWFTLPIARLSLKSWFFCFNNSTDKT